ncbi:MAG: non-canonical purine NTP pyrophosphatase [Algisphaera sp.]
MKICLATTNPHKLEEVQAIFDATAPGSVTWTTLDQIQRDLQDSITDPVEDQDTFEGNALLKARYYAQKTGLICLADDSGIEVDALDNRPGVKSARYSGVRGPRSKVDPANNARLLEELAGKPDAERGARYVCAMALVIPAKPLSQTPAAQSLQQPGEQDAHLIVRGELVGRILRPEEAADPKNPQAGRGANGFGYDPIVMLEGDRTAAEYTPAEKNAVSHRGHATRTLVTAMKKAGLL